MATQRVELPGSNPQPSIELNVTNFFYEHRYLVDKMFANIKPTIWSVFWFESRRVQLPI